MRAKPRDRSGRVLLSSLLHLCFTPLCLVRGFRGVIEFLLSVLIVFVCAT